MLINTSTGSASTLSKAEWVDTHAHLNFSAFNKDREQVIKRCLDNNVWVINIGTKYETSKIAVEIAEEHEKGIYAAIGLHPIHLGTGLVKIKTDPEEGDFEAKAEDFDKEKFKKLADSKKVVAFGEIGLDYYYRPKTKKKLALFKEKQRELFLEELDLAKELSLPVIFHCRMAHDDIIETLKSSTFNVKGVVHCFTGNWQQAEKYLDMGFYLGFNGIIFKNIENINFKKVIETTPLDKILIETDCPYLAPPQAQTKRNEPIFVKYIAQEIAGIKNLSFEKVAQTTTKNAREFFNI